MRVSIVDCTHCTKGSSMKENVNQHVVRAYVMYYRAPFTRPTPVVRSLPLLTDILFVPKCMSQESFISAVKVARAHLSIMSSGIVNASWLQRACSKSPILSKRLRSHIEHSKNSLLIADMKCHQKLLGYQSLSNKILWKYALPMAGSELPITSYARFHNKLSRGLQNDESSVESFSVPPDNMKARFTKQQLSQSRKIISNNFKQYRNSCLIFRQN